MIQVTNATPIAYCNVEIAEEFYGIKIQKGRYGYCIIDGKLVPLSLLSRINDHLCGVIFDAEDVLSPREMVGKKFWKSLSKDEQDILPACLFQLIAEGFISFNFPE
jgi:hypothetical protein